MFSIRDRKKYFALTVMRRGKLSKSHLSDPKEGLPLDAKIRQEEPVEVVLEPVKSTPLEPNEK